MLLDIVLKFVGALANEGIRPLSWFLLDAPLASGRVRLHNGVYRPATIVAPNPTHASEGAWPLITLLAVLERRLQYGAAHVL